MSHYPAYDFYIRIDISGYGIILLQAAGEGINLQFCHLMINYDIPWNPNRL